MNDNQTTRELEHRIAILELKLRIAELERDMALEGMSVKQGEQAVRIPLEPTRWIDPTCFPTCFPTYGPAVTSPPIFHQHIAVTRADPTGAVGFNRLVNSARARQ